MFELDEIYVFKIKEYLENVRICFFQKQNAQPANQNILFIYLFDKNLNLCQHV